MRTILPVMGVFLSLMTACSDHKQPADLILTGGTIYCLDEAFSTAGAMAVRDGRILETGPEREILATYSADHIRDLDGGFVYPGWIDPHCHFYGYGLTLAETDLTGTVSLDDVLSRLRDQPPDTRGGWITGRGWDQNDWEVKEYPGRTDLDEIFPDTPVLLRRVDGHAAWVNSEALRRAGITGETRVEGGSVLLKDGKPSGILLDNAISLVNRMIPPVSPEEIRTALLRAQDSCFSVGLTSVQDAGLGRNVVDQIRTLQEEGLLKMRINAWLSPTEENFRTYVEKGPFQDELLTVNTIKLYADGALGSRGAWLIEPYSDDPNTTGLSVTPLNEIEAFCRRAYDHHFAVATHCIGDRANREILRLYAGILEGRNDRRWRIEHAQVIHPEDFHYFGDFNIIPSVQATHATSDMDWAGDRLGPDRMKYAYAYHTLLEENGWIPNGSDFPVEDIRPLYGFYAAVARKDRTGNPPGGFQRDEALTRQQALCAMTIWAARAGGEDELKGSLEKGKLADFVITGADLMTAPEETLFKIRVLSTYSAGVPVYEFSRNDRIPVNH